MVALSGKGWKLARSLQVLADEVEARWPGTTIWSIGDPAHASRASDHNPRPGDRVVCAIDIVGPAAPIIWAHLLETRDPRLKYFIHAKRIVSSTNQPWVIRPYNGDPHANHIHVSVGRGPDGKSTGPVDDPSPWGLLEDDMPSIQEVEAAVQRVVDRNLTLHGLTTAKETTDYTGNLLRSVFNATLRILQGEGAAVADVDEEAIAGLVLASLNPDAIAKAVTEHMPDYELVKR